ncbi:MAG TPA: hypothetical protein VK157_10870 [Phycisphaerales bacterium]|nr:hypothetical protein [Phycisphaerales bacterium]
MARADFSCHFLRRGGARRIVSHQEDFSATKLAREAASETSVIQDVVNENTIGV